MIKKHILFLLIIVTCHYVKGQSNELQRYYREALNSYRNGDYASFYDLIIKAHNIHPYHQGILYQAGLAAALNNKSSEAVRYLKEAILIQADFSLDVPELKSIRDLPDFKKLKELQQKAGEEIIQSDTAFVIHDRSLHAEGIAKIDGENTFFIGSIHKRKIVQWSDGVLKDFTSSGQDGLTSVFALKVDNKKKVLWACSSPMPEMDDSHSNELSAVFKYDLKTGKLIKKFTPVNPSLELVLGDLVIDKKGNVLVSDSKNNFIFKVNENTGKLDQFYSSEEFWSIQGITFSDDGKFLFIADYIKGLFRLELTTMKLTQLSKTFEASLKSIDGLVYYNNSLFAIQNGLTPMRVTHYFLSKDQSKLVSYIVIDQRHPAFNEPTQGCLSGGIFYYVANSQWSGYNNEHHIKPDNELQDIVILARKLK